MQFDQSNRTHRLVLAGLLAAFILALTLVVSVPIPNMAGAYVNLGDAGVYLAAALLGGPWGALCAAVGSALADLLLGSALYAGPTFLIKGLMAYTASLLMRRWESKKAGKWLALICAGLIMPAGYLLFEGILYGFDVAILGAPLNLLQYVVGVALGIPAIRAAESYFRLTKGKLY